MALFPREMTESPLQLAAPRREGAGGIVGAGC